MRKRILLVIFLMLALSLGLYAFRQQIVLKAAEWSAQRFLKKRLGSELAYQNLVLKDNQLLIEQPFLALHEEQTFKAERISIHYHWKRWGLVELEIAVENPLLILQEQSSYLTDLLAHLSLSPPSSRMQYRLAFEEGVIAIKQQRPLHFELAVDSRQGMSALMTGAFDPEDLLANRFTLKLEREGKAQIVSGELHRLSAAAISPYLAPVVRQLTRWQVHEGELDGQFSLDLASIDTQANGTIRCRNLAASHRYIPLGMDIGGLSINFGGEAGAFLRIDNLEQATLQLAPKQEAACLVKELTGHSTFTDLENVAFSWQGTCHYGEGSCRVNISGNTSLAQGSSPLDQIKVNLEGTAGELLQTFSSSLQIDKEFADQPVLIEAIGHKKNGKIPFHGTVSMTSLLSQPLEFGFLLHQSDDAPYDVSTGWFKAERLPIGPVTLTNLHGEAKLAQGKVEVEHIEAFSEGVYLMGAATLDFTAEGQNTFELRTHTLSGKASQVKQLLAAIEPTLLMCRIPLEGNVSLVKEGGWLKVSLAHGAPPQLEAKIQGQLSDGALASAVADTTFQDLSFNFDYDYAQDTLNIGDLQGSLLMGHPGNDEEYLLAADRLHFSKLSENILEFDLWIGDRKRDIIRLAGMTASSQKYPGKIEVAFDKRLTHFGEMHPEILELRLNSWGEVDYFRGESQLRLNTFWHDLQRLSLSGTMPFSQSAFKAIHHIKNLAGQINLSVEYERGLAAFIYQIKGSDLAFNSSKIANFSLHGKKSGGLWTIDQLVADDLSLSADLVRNIKGWRIKFLGIKYGKSLLIGLKGTFLPEEGRLKGSVDLLEVKLDSLGEFDFLRPMIEQLKPKGELKAAGSLSLNLYDQERLWDVNADLKISTKSLALNDTPVADLASFPLHCAAGPHQLSLEVHLPFHQKEVDLRLRARYPEWTDGEVAIADGKGDPLVLYWSYDAAFGYILRKAHGSLSGLEIDLDRDVQVKDQLVGSVLVNVSDAKGLLPQEFGQMVDYFGLGKSYRLTGRWHLGEGLSLRSFQGKVKGNEYILRGYQFKSLSADLTYHPEKVKLLAVRIEDPAGALTLPALELWKDEKKQEWLFKLDQLGISDFRPSLLRKAEATAEPEAGALLIPALEIVELSGKVYDQASWRGNGRLEFTTRSSPKEAPHPLFAVPAEMINRLGLDVGVLNPAYGEVSYEVTGDKIYLTHLKDVYSDGKLSKFSLSAPPRRSFLDFAGNLSIHLKMKQYNLLFKFTELLTLTIKGNLQRPAYSLQKQTARGELDDDA